MEQHTGTRIKAWRKRRGLTQAALAGFAGVSQSYVSQLESGLKDIERRSTLVSFARALQVAAHDLVNDAEPTDPLRSAANAAIPQLRAVLLEMALGERQHAGRSKEATRAEWQAICDLRRTGGYTSITPRLPDLLTDLAAHNDDALPDALGAASACIRFLGHRDLARDAAEVGISRAQERDSHTWAAHLKRVWIRGMPIETAALSARQAMRVTDELQSRLSDPAAREVYGGIHLEAALQEAVAGRTDNATAHLTEAAQEAATLGEPRGTGFANCWFGPTNIQLWRIAMGEIGEPERVLELARTVRVPPEAPADRTVALHTDTGRALARTGSDREALISLAKAERAAPQVFRSLHAAQDTVRTILTRQRRREEREGIHALANRLGLRDYYPA